MLGWVRALPRRSQIVLGVLFVLGSLWFFSIDSGAGYRGARVDGDGVYYWLYLRSIVVDGDVDFRNDYAKWGNPWGYANGPRGLPTNPTTVGTALLWAPFYLPARAVVLASVKLGAALTTDGTSRIEELAAFYGSFLYGFLSVLLAVHIGRRRFPETPALVGAVGAALGGLLVFYMIVQPSYSHAPSAFVVALFIERWDATRAHRSLRAWVLLGALGGLCALVRPELAVLGLLPVSDLVRRAAARISAEPAAEPAPSNAHALLGAGLAMATALVCFVPQMVCWKIIHGAWLTVPQGSSFMQWGSALWSEALFHPRAGLFPWMPLAIPAALGLFMLARREPSFGVPLLLMALATAYVNGATWDWWGGYSYGARRFTALTPVLALGLAAFADAAWRFVSARSRAFSAGVLLCTLGGFCLLNLMMVENRRFDLTDWYQQREFYRVYLEALRAMAKNVHWAVGNPFSWPANLAFAARHHVSPGRYDPVVGRYFLEEGHGVAHPIRIRTMHEELALASPGLEQFLTSGFGQKRVVEGRQLLDVTGDRACVLFPVVQRPDLRLTLTGRSQAGPARVRARWNGKPLGEQQLPVSFGSLAFKVPGSLLRRGVNKICFDVMRPPPRPAGDRLIGKTGVHAPVDLAAVSSLEWGELWIDDRKVGPNRRGMNAAAVLAGGGVRTAQFDLSQWPEGSLAFVRWVEALPKGTVVMLAVRLDAGRLFGPYGPEALHLIGADTDLRNKVRHTYAAIGVRGAARGSALEVTDRAGRAAFVSVGAQPSAWAPAPQLEKIIIDVIKPMAFD